MLEKFGVHMSWLGAGGGKTIVKSKVIGNNPNSMQMGERNGEGQQQENDQLPIVLPQLQLDMALVLVLVQDNSVALNNPGSAPSKNRLAPPTPNMSKYRATLRTQPESFSKSLTEWILLYPIILSPFRFKILIYHCSYKNIPLDRIANVDNMFDLT